MARLLPHARLLPAAPALRRSPPAPPPKNKTSPPPRAAQGSLRVDAPSGSETQLSARDAARLRAGGKPLHLSLASGPEGSHFLMVEMKQAD